MDAGSKGRALRESADFSACVWGGGDDFLRGTDPFPVPVPRVECGWFRGDVDAAVVLDVDATAGGGKDVVDVARGGCECECECGW